MDSEDWYLRHFDKVELGPYSLSALVRSASIGNIATDTEVRHQDHTKGMWVLATKVKAIREAIGPEAPPIVDSVQPVLATEPTYSTKKRKWKWWPDHPAKKAMVIVTMCWPLAILAFFWLGYYSSIYEGEPYSPGSTDRVIGLRRVELGERRLRGVVFGVELAFSTFKYYAGTILLCWIAWFMIEFQDAAGDG